jgi:carboxypeptidase family protein/TonB-dependent receptor-like protein
MLLSFLAPAGASAQADSGRSVIEGRVLDPLGVPLAEAEVLWQPGQVSAFTKSDGSFSLVVPIRGEVVILVRRVGYSAQALRVDLARIGSWRGDIVLVPGSHKLPDLDVTVRNAKPARYAATDKYDDFFRRRRLAAGTFITREEIEKMNAFSTLEILRGIRGVYVNVGLPGDPHSADIRFTRCHDGNAKITVWIDGHMLQETQEKSNQGRDASFKLAEMLSRITPTGIEAVEVYRGVSEIPGEFHWDGCAAIVIWTR